MASSYSHTITEDDVLEVREILYRFLPLELIFMITAWNYGPIALAQREYPVGFQCYNVVGAQEIATLYLVSPSVTTDRSIAGAYQPQYVKFKIRSSVYEADIGRIAGSYGGSRSWFEGTILRRANNDAIVPRRYDLLDGGFYASWWRTVRQPHEAYPYLAEQGWDFVRDANDDPLIWHIQSNKISTEDLTDHEVIWRRGQRAQTTDPTTGDSNGAGDGAGFVATLQDGDRIAIWARASGYPRINRVGSASIEVGFEEI